MILTPYEQGLLSAIRGDPERNPYPVGTEDHEDWERGYVVGSQEEVEE